MKITILAALVSTALITGCASTDDPNRATKIGGVTGAIGGAVIGKQLGGDKGTILGAVIGTGAGLLIGKDRDAQQRRLEESLQAERQENQLSISRVDNDTIKLNIDSAVTFPTDSYRINDDFRFTLNKIAASIEEFPNTRVDIIGHTDSTGTTEYNQRLSEQRAEAVGQYFGTRGVSYSRLFTEGRGEKQPIASNETVSGRATNRRVEIYLRSAQQ